MAIAVAAAALGAPSHATAAGGGLHEVVLEDGSSIYTHGGDPVRELVDPADQKVREALEHKFRPGDASSISCAASGAPRFVVVYARSRRDQDRYGEIAPLLRQAVYDASEVMDLNAIWLNAAAGARYVVECDSEGTAVVHNAVLRTRPDRDSFSTVVNDLRRLGYSKTSEKYVVFYDDCVPWGDEACIGGLGTTTLDDKPGPENLNNFGPSYAMLFGDDDRVPSWLFVMHEIGHAMGAVQPSAPNSTAGFHCTDGRDVMCYDDGSDPASDYNSTLCPVRRFDCMGDDYFNPSPLAVGYLSDRWNIGAGYNRFLDHSAR